MSGETIRERSVFFLCGGVACVEFFGVFLRGPPARCSVFLLQNRCFYPVRPLPPFFCAEHAFLALFSEPGTCNCVKHDDWDWSDPRTLLGVPSPPLSRSRRWPSAGLLVGGRLAVVMSHVVNSDVVCRCGDRGDRGSLFASQSSCPGSSRRHGSHLPYTSVGLLR